MTRSQAKVLAVTLTLIGCILFCAGTISCAFYFFDHDGVELRGTILISIGLLSVGLGRFFLKGEKEDQ